MFFKNREDAGKQLLQRLIHYKRTDAAVYTLPRGGVEVGLQIASALDLPLLPLCVRKVPHPLSPEYAVCAVGKSGTLVCNEEEKATVDPGWLSRAIEKERKEVERRCALYREDASFSLKDKIAIIVDDGAATGLTLRAAILELKKKAPKKIILALPVLPADTARILQEETDELVALCIDKNFLGAVGAYYEDFPQLSDAEVIRLLEKSIHA